MQVSGVCENCGGAIDFPLGQTQVTCQFCDAGMAVADDARLVRLTCPSCDGHFCYIDGVMAGDCPFCHVELLALTHNRLLRYVVRPKIDQAPTPTAKRCWVPFWRLGGLLFGWDYGKRVDVETEAVQTSGAGGQSVETFTVRKDSGPQRHPQARVVERWLPDPSALAYGIKTLRMRGHVFSLEPFDKSHESIASPLPITMQFEEAQEGLMTSAMNLGYHGNSMTQLDCQRADLVAEGISVVYYPFWIDTTDGCSVWDAVTGEAEPLAPPQYTELQPSKVAFDQLKVIERRCEKCREPLPLGSHSVVLPCMHCKTAWVIERQGLKPFEAMFASSQVENTEGSTVWLPFWQVGCRVSLSGREATQALDARNVLNVMTPPGQGARAEPTAPLCYFAPAYGGLRAPRLDHAARDMTRLQTAPKVTSYDGGDLFTCFYGPDDAVRLAYVVWLDVIRTSVAKQVRSMRISCDEPILWYLPFANQGREMRNLVTGMRYDRSAFRGVGH